MDQLPLFLLTGAFAGLLAGLFGVGGGLVMVPVLALLLPARGVGPEVYMQVAIGTSLAVIALTSLSSTAAHHRRGGVRWDVLRRYAPGLAAGAVLGALIADQLTGLTLQRIVGVGAVGVALQMLGAGPAAGDAAGATAAPAPGAARLALAGGVIGALSSLIGIGGGSLSVPFLSWCGLAMRQAVGTSAAGGVPIAWAGALAFAAAGWGDARLPPGTLGYVSLPGFAGLALASVLAAPLGARLAHRLPPRTLRRGFALLLLAIGIRMLWG